ncbi:MAG: carbohydrate binding domain-containing protein [Oscillospiraceae bacterium]|nr:carbohydrate binding domain-containing protein [Oscillospiraceae bacterium]
MKTIKAVKSLIAGLTAGVMLCSASAAIPDLNMEVKAASVCSVNTDKTYQMIRGFGGMNLPEWISQGDLTDAQRQKAFGNGADELGLTVLRIYVSDDKNSWSRAVPTAKYAQKMGATVFATPWNPPSSIRQNGTGGARGGKYHLPSNQYSAYVQHLNDYYNYMKNNGVDLYSISIQNEPDYSMDWTAWSSDEATTFLANYGDQLQFRVMSPETFQYTNKDYYTKILNNSKAFANTDVFGTHFYGTLRSQMDFAQLEASGKEIWMTEVYVPNSDADSANRWPEAVKVGVNIHNGLVVGNMSAYTWWYIRRSYGLMTEDGKISKRGYCMAQYSKYVRPGDVRIDVTEQPATDVYVSAYKHSDKQIEIVAVNASDTGYSQQFSVGNRTITDIDRYRTSSNENIAATNDLDHEASTFWAQLPAQSVSTFVISLESDGKDVPSGPDTPKADEPDENGYYFHDTFEGDVSSWEARGSSEILLSGRSPYKDAEALLVQNRESAWNGAQKALNGLTFEAGKEYSFSACVQNLDGADSQNFMLSLQYTLDGETKYDHIAQATAIKGHYVQLANPSYKIPAGASSPVLYIETESGTDNFYIDEVIGAVKGTKIDGPSAVNVTLGDINSDGFINIADLVLCKNVILTAETADAVAKVAADVDKNGQNNAADLVLMQKYLFGIIDTFPAA